MRFETEAEKLFSQLNTKAVTLPYEYIEYGNDFVRFKNPGGNVFEIRVREIKPRVKTLSGK